MDRRVVDLFRFYSSPSCDGDLSITGTDGSVIVSILPRLATGIITWIEEAQAAEFLFFPVLRRGSAAEAAAKASETFLFFPVLRRGSYNPSQSQLNSLFLFFPVLRRGSRILCCSWKTNRVSILPRLATGIRIGF